MLVSKNRKLSLPLLCLNSFNSLGFPQIWERLKHITAMKKKRSVKKGPLQIGILGCMAERLKTKLLEKEQLVDVGKSIILCSKHIHPGSYPS